MTVRREAIDGSRVEYNERNMEACRVSNVPMKADGSIVVVAAAVGLV